MTFATPYILWLLLVILPMVAWYIYQNRKGGATIRISSIEAAAKTPRTLRYYLRHVPFVVRTLAIALMIIALARPQRIDRDSYTTSEGIDIVLAMDISSSMLARDFKPDRITAAKEVAAQFVADRPTDRIGVVAFAGEAFTQSPLTNDKNTLQTMISRLESGIIEDGTAIGNGLATATNRLRESDAKSKVIILLTDGVNNRGEVAPMTAAQIAMDQGVRVYTIGVGSQGTAPYPTMDLYGNITFQNAKVEIDEKTLQEIAEATGGQYFRATDKDKLQEVYDQINQLEKSKVELFENITFSEEYWILLIAALLLLSMEFVAKHLLLNRIP